MDWIFRVSQENTAATVQRIMQGFDGAGVESNSSGLLQCFRDCYVRP